MTKVNYPYQLPLSFFGLGLDYKPILHSEIHSIVWFGRGGYNWETVYNWPIWLRRFYSKKIQDSMIEEAKLREDAAKGKKSSKSPKVDRPKIPMKK